MMHRLRKEEDKLPNADINAEREVRRPELVRDERMERTRESQIREEAEEERSALFPDHEVRDMRSHWDRIQTGFVDEPRRAVEQADGLVASANKRIAEQFAQERARLEQQWNRGDNVSTEDLRLALQRYRAYFDRLLSM
jgi:hypothetical protein